MTPLEPTSLGDVCLLPDARRVIAVPFLPGEEVFPDGSSRIELVLARILALDEGDVGVTLACMLEEFGDRHCDLESVLRSHFAIISDRVDLPAGLSKERELLIGAYFSQERAVEAAALTNPSMVAAPDQSGLEPGAKRFVMTLRAVGEGHISSIEFRTGVINRELGVSMEGPARYAAPGHRTPAVYDRRFFTTKLLDIGADNEVAARVLDQLGSRFTMAQLEEAIRVVEADDLDRAMSLETIHILHWLASSNYVVSFADHVPLSERVIVPAGPTESHGMEDARAVRFVDDDGRVTYYATYTAFDGHQILPQLIETTDFASFRIATMSGEGAQNKGMALFPRKIEGRFMALGRHDSLNNFLMSSTDVREWRAGEKLREPERPWELAGLGNCGSPLETEAGWLVITHGVGPFRRYSLGALLLDADDPVRVIGHLRTPLLVAGTHEREGYVPNVVYSCGSMIHGRHLVVPYGFADVGTRMACFALDELLSRLTDRAPVSGARRT